MSTNIKYVRSKRNQSLWQSVENLMDYISIYMDKEN